MTLCQHCGKEIVMVTDKNQPWSFTWRHEHFSQYGFFCDRAEPEWERWQMKLI